MTDHGLLTSAHHPDLSSRSVKAGMERLALSPGKSFLVIFLLAFSTRLLLLTLTPLENITTAGAEMEKVARTLALTGEMADPYYLPTGPTAHLAPFCPALIGLIYYLFGLTVTAGYIRCLLIIISFSSVFGLIPWLSKKITRSPQAGFLGGLAGAFCPQWPDEVCLSWEGSYAALVLAFLLVAFLDRWVSASTSARNTFLLGLACGAAFHITPALLPVFLGCFAFELWWRKDKPRWSAPAIWMMGVILVCLPWAWRNYSIFGEIFFIRSNVGIELRLANHDGATATLEGGASEKDHIYHPGGSSSESRLVIELGEPEYNRRALRETLSWIVSDPGQFAGLTAKRFLYFWSGHPEVPIMVLGYSLLTLLAVLGACRIWPRLDAPHRAAFFIPLVTYPLIYYLTKYAHWYRVPIHWILLMLAGAAAWEFLRPRHQPGESV